jgi:hypothetical protein
MATYALIGIGPYCPDTTYEKYRHLGFAGTIPDHVEPKSHSYTLQTNIEGEHPTAYTTSVKNI